MTDIGELLKETREESGVDLEEASKDLNIKIPILENIESGNMGCFKDIFVLKDYIHSYSKYLGLDPDKIIDEFNEHMFNTTSKLSIKEIEAAIREKEKESTNEKKVSSPYTTTPKKQKLPYILIYVLIIFLVIVVIIWSVKQITVNKEIANQISYVK